MPIDKKKISAIASLPVADKTIMGYKAFKFCFLAVIIIIVIISSFWIAGFSFLSTFFILYSIFALFLLMASIKDHLNVRNYVARRYELSDDRLLYKTLKAEGEFKWSDILSIKVIRYRYGSSLCIEFYKSDGQGKLIISYRSSGLAILSQAILAKAGQANMDEMTRAFLEHKSGLYPQYT